MDNLEFILDYTVNVRVTKVLLNCNLDQIQQLYTLGILLPNTIGWESNYGDCNLLTMFLVRENLGNSFPDLLQVSEDQIKDTIRFLVNHGIDINYFNPGPRVVTSPTLMISYCTPLEIAIYLRKYPMVVFLTELGANPPRPLPFLTDSIAAWEQYKVQQRNLAAFRQTMGNLRPRNANRTSGYWYEGPPNPALSNEMAGNVGSLVGEFLTGIHGSQAQQALKKRRRTRRR